MKVAVVSDTHDNLEAINKIIKKLQDLKIKIVVHLGDYVAPFSLRKFSGFELYGVFGNNDGEKIMLKKIAEEEGFKIEDAPFEFEIGGKKFVIIHGVGSIEKTKSWSYSLAKSGNYDYVLYGHTHRVDVKKVGNTIVMNPGEACGYLTGKRTFAFLDVDTGKIEIIDM